MRAKARDPIDVAADDGARPFGSRFERFVFAVVTEFPGKFFVVFLDPVAIGLRIVDDSRPTPG